MIINVSSVLSLAFTRAMHSVQVLYKLQADEFQATYFKYVYSHIIITNADGKINEEVSKVVNYGYKDFSYKPNIDTTLTKRKRKDVCKVDCSGHPEAERCRHAWCP